MRGVESFFVLWGYLIKYVMTRVYTYPAKVIVMVDKESMVINLLFK